MVLLLDEPTQGVDVTARQEIYAMVRRAAAAGTSLVVVANDFAELAQLIRDRPGPRRRRLLGAEPAPRRHR